MLAPLRQNDVIHAVEINKLNVNHFIDEIKRNDSGPLASHPLTLNFLINLFKRDNRLPPSKRDLYYDGCLQLCEEQNQYRRDAGHTGNLDPKQRMIVAARIAAITIFCNFDAIWTSPDSSSVPDGHVHLPKLIGGKELANDINFNVEESLLKEALRTGLFSTCGPHSMRWYHRTYAEFLAAWYLMQHEMNDDRLMQLLRHPDDPAGKLVPQLHGTSSWLASMDRDIFRKIIEIEPKILLKCDLSMMNTDKKSALVRELLQLYDNEQLLDNDLGLRAQYSKLNYDGLSNHILPYICDKSKGIVVRRVAIDIVEACGLRMLQSQLLKIALDQEEDCHIRYQAVDAIGKIGNPETKRSLRSLIPEGLGEDPHDELKGAVLDVLWPKYLNADELFTNLTIPKRRNLIGSYFVFLNYRLIAGLRLNDLSRALVWIKEITLSWRSEVFFKELIKSILYKAWDALNHPGVLETFSKMVWTFYKEYDYIIDVEFKEKFRSDSTKRREVLNAILALLDSEKDSSNRIYIDAPLIFEDDMPWLIERCKNERSDRLHQIIAEIIDLHTPKLYEFKYVDTLLKACEEDIILAERFNWLREGIVLDSPEAKNMRELYQKLEIKKTSDSSVRVLLLPKKKIVNCLEPNHKNNHNPALSQNCFLNENMNHYR